MGFTGLVSPFKWRITETKQIGIFKEVSWCIVFPVEKSTC